MLTQDFNLIRSYNMNIEDAQYNKNLNGDIVDVKITEGGKIYFVPLNPANRHYAEILKQVKEGTLTIKEAE